MGLVSVALWTLALALVGLGIFALFEGWLLPNGRELARLRAAWREE